MLDALIQYDIQLFLSLNKWGSPKFDDLIYFLSNHFLIWASLILIPLFACFKRYKKNFISLFFFSLLAVGISDLISSQILKPTVKRPRPCREVSIKKEVYIPFGKSSCAGKYGFTSSHASNSFAIAYFFFLLLGRFSRKWWGLLLAASFISLTRIYLAKHYPLDLIFGTLIGLASARFSFFLWQKWINRQQSQFQS